MFHFSQMMKNYVSTFSDIDEEDIDAADNITLDPDIASRTQSDNTYLDKSDDCGDDDNSSIDNSIESTETATNASNSHFTTGRWDDMISKVYNTDDYDTKASEYVMNMLLKRK